MTDVKRKTANTNVRRTVTFVGVLLAATIVGTLLFIKSCESRQRLSRIPNGLRVSKIVYAEETSPGIGPGGNESGVIVYELPEDVAETIKQNGIGFFANSLGGEGGDDLTKRYEKWEETPLLSDSSWREAGEEKTTAEPRLENYLNSYGYGAVVEPEILREINAIVSKPGAYFARGRSGIIIVSPAAKKVIYTYSG